MKGSANCGLLYSRCFSKKSLVCSWMASGPVSMKAFIAMETMAPNSGPGADGPISSPAALRSRSSPALSA
eukprot:4952518-Pyramimonas_sp.AAC.2